MIINPPPYDKEAARISALIRYRDLDYSSNSEFQTIAKLAAEICETSISVITFVDEKKVDLLFTHGIEGVTCVPKDISFCQKTVHKAALVEIPDTRLDPEFKNIPLVIDGPKILFYTGMPLITYDGFTIGTLCVMDQQPKKLSSTQISSLTQLSKIVIKLFESKLIESLSRTNESFIQAIDEIIYDYDLLSNQIKWSGAYTRILGFSIEEMGTDAESWLEKVHQDDLPAVLEELEAVKKEGRLYDLEYRFAQRNGDYLWMHDRGVIHFDKDGQAVQVVGIMRDVNKRKLIEAEKREQESHSRLFFNTAPVCIHGIDLQGCFTSMNPSGLKMLDLKSEEQIIGTSYLAGVREKDYDQIKQFLENALRGEMSNFEFTGTSGNVYSSCFVPIKNEQGEVIRLMGISEDITVRKNAEDKLAKEMERLELVMRATNDSVWDLDKATNKVWWNETYTDTFGRPPDENTLVWWLERIHPNDRERVQSSLVKISETNIDRWSEKYQFKKPDGNYCYVDDHAYIARDKKGKATRILGALRDITESKHAEQELREINIALSHSLPGISHLDSNGLYTYINNTYAELLGYTPQELIGQSWKVTVDPSELVIGERGYQKMLEKENVEYDIKGICKDGSPIFKHVLISKRIDNNGSFIGHQCFMKDITDRVEQEKKHKQLQDELAHVARLSNMDEMATGLAHELNQPLSAISHYVDAAQTLLAAEPNTNNKLLEIMQSASEQVLRAGEIVRHCRQFASKQPMEKCAIDLNDLTQETVRFLNSDAQDNNISIHVTLDDQLPSIEIDKVQIQQVLVNLIRNGIEAMQNNNGKARTLTVYTHLNGTNRNEYEAQVTVKDTGPGLKISQTENLFQPFYTTKSTGMGMGLSISRSIIDAHGGKLWLDSQHNSETQFHFTLPIETEQSV